MLYFISATTVTRELQPKELGTCQFCLKKPAETGTRTCGTCRRRLNTRSEHILTGIPKRPVWKADLFDARMEEALDAGIFADDRGMLATRAFSPESYEDDPGGSYDNARRAREDGR